MLRVWTLTAAYSTVVAACALACAVAARINLRGLHDARRRPPLERAEILTAVPTDSLIPTSWPAPNGLTDVRMTAAYRDYAHERRDALVLLGDLSVVTGGAALGASLPAAVNAGWHTWPGAAAILLSTLGLLLRHRGQEKWIEAARLYERRLLALTDPPTRTILAGRSRRGVMGRPTPPVAHPGAAGNCHPPVPPLWSPTRRTTCRSQTSLIAPTSPTTLTSLITPTSPNPPVRTARRSRRPAARSDDGRPRRRAAGPAHPMVGPVAGPDGGRARQVRRTRSAS
jgi:hypothetical protein